MPTLSERAMMDRSNCGSGGTHSMNLEQYRDVDHEFMVARSGSLGSTSKQNPETARIIDGMNFNGLDSILNNDFFHQQSADDSLTRLSCE